MGVVVDKILGKPLLHSHAINVFSSDPSTGKNGQLIINSSDLKMKIWYGNQWQVLHQLDAGIPEVGNPMGLLLTLTYSS